ncbi:hypothetical protein [Qipengyuania oceanensis]|uniref:hypothetical protein n=1 Tax=Qipengyuania oceanensis TaxID=1463597 RepID=UPI00301E0BC4
MLIGNAVQVILQEVVAAVEISGAARDRGVRFAALEIVAEGGANLRVGREFVGIGTAGNGEFLVRQTGVEPTRLEARPVCDRA